MASRRVRAAGKWAVAWWATASTVGACLCLAEPIPDAPPTSDASCPTQIESVADALPTSVDPGSPKDRPLRHGVFRWTSYPAAWTAAQKTNRPILVYVSSAHCPYCVRMLSETYQSPRVKDTVVSSFETVYVDRQSQPELVAALGVRLFPTTVLVAPNNKVVDLMEGYVAADAFGRRLQTNLAAVSATRKR
ncbi:MAG: thioredoxin fold domain-containing protein [Planctomycetales bacterium]|nr:thioredoxin fold domain-containing protein [Planctomycetales bacterium]